MRSTPYQIAHQSEHSAESAFAEAFARLVSGTPLVLPPGTSVTQNNVAREAGRDPSALKKARYPDLVLQIQDWIQKNPGPVKESERRAGPARKGKMQALQDRVSSLKMQRDQMASMLVEADAKILELTLEVARLEALNASARPAAFGGRLPKRRHD